MKVYTHIPLAVAVVLGVLCVAGNLAIDRSLWRQNRVRLSKVVDPVTGELPGGRLPIPPWVRCGFPLWALALIAIVLYLAAI
ncbi:MAG: hypothetical protein ACRDLP_00415 [Solirubrobacteraceae bacterium]